MKNHVVFALVCFLSPLAFAGSRTDSERLSGGNGGFAFNLLKQITKAEPARNILISPYSASSALQMVCNGAAGQTKAEMQQVLGTTGVSQNMLNDACKDIATSLNLVNRNVVLTTANAIWCRKGASIKPEFIACNQRFFGATVDNLISAILIRWT